MRGSTWLAMGKLGSSLAQVAAGEWKAIRDEVRHSARLSVGALLTLGASFAFLAAALIGALLAMAEGMVVWMPRWAALLVLSLMFGAVAGFLFWRARRVIHDVDTPREVVRRRWRDHHTWIRKQLGGGDVESESE